jgi:hypothetical protein
MALDKADYNKIAFSNYLNCIREVLDLAQTALLASFYPPFRGVGKYQLV